VSRTRKFVEPFVNSDPDSVCPTFLKLTPATHCPFDCQFCFLQGTYRTLRPGVCLYTDLPGMLRDIDGAIMRRDLCQRPRDRKPLVFNAGEMCDSLATLGLMPGLLPELVNHFSEPGYDKLLLLTKSARTGQLLDLDHRGSTIVAWSLNCNRVIQEVELGAASLDERLGAARACQEAGYPVRFRFDPLVAIDIWEEQYSEMVERTLATVVPERITLGSYRLLGNLDRIIEQRFPDSTLLNQELERDGKRLRYPHELRRRMYEFVIGEIRKHDDTTPVSICKETPRMWADLKQHLTPRACNCLP